MGLTSYDVAPNGNAALSCGSKYGYKITLPNKPKDADVKCSSKVCTISLALYASSLLISSLYYRITLKWSLSTTNLSIVWVTSSAKICLETPKITWQIATSTPLRTMDTYSTLSLPWIGTASPIVQLPLRIWLRNVSSSVAFLAWVSIF